MITKHKNLSRHKDGHSREHTSNLRSHSRSTDKNKQRSNSKLMLKLKPSDHSQEEASDCNPSYHIISRMAAKKTGSTKQIDTSNEYYSHFRGKSKSKGKLIAPVDDANKVKYLNSVYMHKDGTTNMSISQLQQSSKNAESVRGVDKEQVVASSTLLNKIKMLEKNCGIDANGRIVAKEVVRGQIGQNSKNLDSQNTISIFEGEKKKQKKRVHDKIRKEGLRGVKSKRGEEQGSKLIRIGMVKSSQKCMKKKESKDVYSPSFFDQYTQAQTTNTLNNFRSKDKVKQVSKLVALPKSNKTLLQQTRTSPNQQIEERVHQRFPEIAYQDVMRQIEEDSRVKLNSQKLRLVYGSELVGERIRCIEFIGKLCSNFNVRRQGHSLAIFYMDRYMQLLDRQVTAKQLRLIAMTALLLALKMDDGIMSRKICHQYISRMQSILQMFKGEGKSRSIQKSREQSSTFSSKQNSGCLSKSKSQTAFTELGVARDDVRRSRKQQVVHSKQMSLILSLQVDMMLKFGFRLVVRSTTYWVDLLTSLWDRYIVEQTGLQQQLMFRVEKNKRNISHLYQMMQRVFFSLEVYSYSVPVLVLSGIYLIVRMHLQQRSENLSERQIYSRFIESFSKSSNMIFYDAVGANEILGHFLQGLEMNISNLIESIRFVGRNMEENMKMFSFRGKSKYVDSRSYQHHLSIYEGNCEMFRGGER